MMLAVSHSMSYLRDPIVMLLRTMEKHQPVMLSF